MYVATGINSSECQQRSTTFPKVILAQKQTTAFKSEMLYPLDKQTTALKSEILYPLDEWVSHNSTRFRLYGLNEGANSLVFKHEPNYRNAAQLLDQDQKFSVRPITKARREIYRSRPMHNDGQRDENNHLKNELDNERHSTTKLHSQNYPSIDGQVLTKTARKRRFYSISQKNEETNRNAEIPQHKSITRNSGVFFQNGEHVPSMNSRTDKTNLGRDGTDRDIGIVRGTGISRSAGISRGIGISQSAGILRGNGINRTGGSTRGIGMNRNVGGTARGIGLNRNIGTARGFSIKRGMGTGSESAQVPATRREDVSASASQYRPPKRDMARLPDQLAYGGVQIVSFAFMYTEKSFRNLIKQTRN